MQLLAPRLQVARRGGREGHALERVVGKQPDQVEEALAVGDAELRKRLRIVRLEPVHVEAEDTRERGALDELLRARAHGALRVHDRLAVVEVEAQERHAENIPDALLRQRP